ncbi:DNA repair protein RecO [Candidatus Wirthbacteria bacterium CG2_30_54_11]|uniref:DNA repair protein RecO n=1 Tax=Candidatus Wirthbacteria bacterium CG2_30_54_11 TaxID=1817892 RepID=A0A1J5IP64_9BACT|nr:MAG: DNA repair protein RecO [Candidatus Wirthbacteria bacterium CG2_30_54_11]
MPNYTVEAVVLKRSDFGEKDRLLTLLSPSHGKIRAIAKGVRRPGSRQAGHLELFAHAKVYLAEGRNLDIITQAETLASHHLIRTDLGMLSLAYYIAELGDALSVEDEKNYPLFSLVKSAFSQIGGSVDHSSLITWFEMTLLDIIGYRPDLEHCAVCATPLGISAGICRDIGGLVCCNCTPHGGHLVSLSGQSMQGLRGVQLSSTWTASADSEAVREEMRLVARHFVTHVMQRELRAEQFMWNVQKLQAIPV